MTPAKPQSGPPPRRGPEDRGRQRGWIAWMTRNSVAANLLMLVLLVGGLVSALTIRQEVFPEFTFDVVTISVPYPGASPDDAEEIVTSIEQAVTGVEGVKRIRGSASEGFASVMVELFDDADPDRALSDIKNQVDRITTLPLDAEQPAVSLVPNRREVLSLVIYGDVDERVLRALAEEARNELKALPNVTEVELSATRPTEIHIDVPSATLRRHELTLERIAQAVRLESMELPAGGIKTDAGEVLLRSKPKPRFGDEFEGLPIASTPLGSQLLVRDLARVRDGFAETDESATFNGQRAVMLRIFRTADQTPIEVADAVVAYTAARAETLPEGIGIATWMDQSEWYRDRLGLMGRNMALGFLLVMIILGLFLETKLAFWVTVGIVVSFAGSMIIVPQFGVSINMISMFAFIVTLGIVVDDAIVVGENIYQKRQRGLSGVRAAIAGAKEMARPVTFSVLTTVAAFTPMFFVPGISGKLFGVIPAIVVSVLAISLIESFFVLPAHLSHGKSKRPLAWHIKVWAVALGILGLFSGLAGPYSALEGAALGAALGAVMPLLWRLLDAVFGFLRRHVARGLAWSIQRVYRPLLRYCMDHRYLTVAASMSVALVACGQFVGGRMDFSFMPDIESDIVMAQVMLPFGAPVEETEAVRDRLVAAATAVLDEAGGAERLSRGVFAQVGRGIPSMGPVSVDQGSAGGHVANVQVYLVPSDERDITAREFTQRWRAQTGEVAGVDTLIFRDSIGGPSAGLPIDIRLIHADVAVLEEAALDLAARLGEFDGVKDIDPGFQQGKPQIDFDVTRFGASLGLTPAEVGRQVRAAFYGAESSRQQRGLDELKVMVRLPEDERRSERDLEDLMLRTPGGEVPFRLAATTRRGFAYTTIRRVDEQRSISVKADVERDVTTPDKVYAELLASDGVLDQLVERYRGLSYGFDGEREEQQQSMASLLLGFLMALLVIYALIAIPFKSYSQPIVVMAVIPLGFGAAIYGHLITGYGLSMISFMGMIALAGVIINGSLVMIDTANRNRDVGDSAWGGIRDAALRRFRPILLTSLTTFGGLAPMIMETSVQARFLIPMAVSLGFGILLTLPFIQLTVPAVYLIVEDVKRLFGLAPPVREVPEPPDEDGAPPETTMTSPGVIQPGELQPA